ncbi:MAG: hypothetical protein ACE1Z9_06105, partial [Acidimicrobiia bacterium]
KVAGPPTSTPTENFSALGFGVLEISMPIAREASRSAHAHCPGITGLGALAPRGPSLAGLVPGGLNLAGLAPGGLNLAGLAPGGLKW